MRGRLVVAVACLLGAFALYAPTLHDRFQGDDFIWLYDASQLHGLGDLFRVHHAGFAKFDGIRFSPVELAFFWLNLRLFGVSPLPFHCAVVFLIAVNAWLLHEWVERVVKSAWAAAAAAVTMLVYPLHYEPHGWVAAVNEPLIGAAVLTCLLALPESASASTSRKCVCWAALGFALLTKPSAASLPLVLLAADVLLLRPRSWGERLALHAPCWALAGGAAVWQAAAVAAARGAGYHMQRPNDLLVAVCGTARYTLGLFLGFDEVAALPPALDVRVAPEAWVATILAAVLYLCLCGWLISTGLRFPAFCLVWAALAMLPYACMVPGAPLEPRYAWPGSLAVAALAGWLCTRLPAKGAFPILLIGWMMCAVSLVRTLQLLSAPDDAQALASQVRAATATLSPAGRLYVYQQAAQQHAAGRAAALFAGLPAERVGDWYEVLSRGRLADGDLMLYFDPEERSFVDLTREVAQALAAPRTPPTEHVDEACGLPVLRTWNMRDPSDRRAWSRDRIEADAGAPVYHVQEATEALVSPPLDLAPFDVFCVEVDYRTAHDGGARLQPRLGWSSPLEGGWGPRRFVPAVLGTRNGAAAAWFFPASRPAWWTEGGVRRFYIAPSAVPADVTVERVTLYGVPRP